MRSLGSGDGARQRTRELRSFFRRGNADIGYGLRPEHPLQRATANADRAGGSTDMSFEEYAAFVGDYTLERSHETSGVPKRRP